MCRVMQVRRDDANMRNIASILEDIKKEEDTLEGFLQDEGGTASSSHHGLGSDDIHSMLEILADAKNEVSR